MILIPFQVCRPSTCTTLTLTTTPAPAEAPSMVTRTAPPGPRTTSLTLCRWCARTAPPGPAGAPRCQLPGVTTRPGCTRPRLPRPWPAPCPWSALLTTPRCPPRCPGPPPPMVTPSTTWPPPMMAWCPATSYLPVMVTIPRPMTVSFTILSFIKYKTCHVIAITATFDPRLFLARMPGTSFQCILSWGFIQFSPLFSCDVISCFRPLLLPAGAGGRHGERGHLPHLELGLLGQELSRGRHLAPPPQQQQQQIGQQHQQR